MKKAVLFIMDGVGDLIPSPLMQAKTPNLDSLAEKGSTGLMYTLGKGRVPESDTAHLTLFGYELDKYYKGRGPLEALGIGIELEDGDIAFRTNFATIKNGEIIDRRAGRIETKIARELGKDLSMKINDVEVIFKHSTEHRGVLVLRGKKLSVKISDTDSHRLGPLNKCKAITKSGKRTAEIVNEYITKVIEKLENNPLNKGRKLPANVLLLRGAGKFMKVPSIDERFGIKTACVAGGALYKGAASYAGMDIIDVHGATGTVKTNLKAKGEAVIKALKKNGFVFLHVKGTDSYSHDGNCKGKKEFLEKIDRELVPILIKSKAGLIITGDHSTPCSLKDHSADPVPLLVYGLEKDSTIEFNESSCSNGKLGIINGKEIMGLILKIIKK